MTDSAEKDAPAVCFEWETCWPHAVPSIAETRTTPDREKVTCDACLWALGTQVSPPPRASVFPPGLLDDYDPVPGLVARGVMADPDEHDSDSCEAACCIPPGTGGTDDT